MSLFKYIITAILFAGLFITAHQIRNRPMLDSNRSGGIYVNVKGKAVYVGDLDKIVKGDSTITLVLKVNDKGTVQE